jgi:hypothetical protein
MSAAGDGQVNAQLACGPGRSEFLVLAEQLGIDPGAMADPRTELSFAMAHRRCAECKSKEQCRRAIREGRALMSAVASFCPSAEVLFDLAGRQLRLPPGIAVPD